MVKKQPPAVRRHAQPLGKAGIAHSLDSVAQKAIEGGKHEVVRAWATHVLKACGWPKGARARAACLLADTRKYAWIPDPVDVEFIPAPWLMMPNVLTGEDAVYLADDCDGLTARWAALCLAAGVRCQIVGYSFDEDKQITHVLASIWDDVAGLWVDGDPSFQDMPLGTTEPHTWEQRRELPTMEITCDDVACDLSKGPNVMAGTVSFVGVGAPKSPEHARAPQIGEPSVAPERLDLSTETLSDIGDSFSDLADKVESRWELLKGNYDAMRAAFAAGGLSTTESLVPWGWTAEHQQRAIDLGVMAQLASRYLREAQSGFRSIWVSDSDAPAIAGIASIMESECAKTGGAWDPANVKCACPSGRSYELGKGCIDAAGQALVEATWAIEKKPGDVLGIELGPGDTPILVNAQGPTHAQPGNTIGTPVAIAIAVGGAVMYVAVAYAIVKGLEYLSDICHTVTDTWQESQITKCYEPGSGVSKEECDKRVADRRAYATKRRELDARIAEDRKGSDPATALEKTVTSLLYIGGAVLTVYGVAKLASAMSAKKKTSTPDI